MAIDISQPQSPGWWMARLSRKLVLRQKRLDLLDRYMRGDPPVGDGDRNMQTVWHAFMRKARSNFAELIVEAPRERMGIQGFRTAVESDDVGDASAWGIWKANNLDVESTQVHEWMLALGDGYVMVGLDADGSPCITAEDPRLVITEHDPMHAQKVIAALKLFHDDVNDIDLAYLCLPGIVYTAGRPRRANPASNAPVSFSPAGWDWVDSDFQVIALDAGLETGEFDNLVGQSLPVAAADVVPVVPFSNKNHRGEFEAHIDLLDRINHTILQRMVITTFQAFRQRAIKGPLPDTDESGNQIDYTKIFSADPGALWMIPEAVDMWESGQADLTGVLASINDDVEHLAAVTRTPMHYLTPGDAAQSAEGASLAKEGLIFKTNDRIARATAGWNAVMYLAFLFTGDAERADLGSLDPIWNPTERYSLSEMASASAQAVTALPWESNMEMIWQMSPEELARARTQRSADMVIAEQQAALAAAAKPPPTIINEPPPDS